MCGSGASLLCVQDSQIVNLHKPITPYISVILFEYKWLDRRGSLPYGLRQKGFGDIAFMQHLATSRDHGLQ